MGKPLSVTLNIYCRKVLALLCATAVALPPPVWGMVRNPRNVSHVDHVFDSSAGYCFQAVVCTERDGTLTKPPQPPTRARGQACQTYTNQAQPIRESFEGEDKRTRVEKPDGWPYSVHAQMESYALDGRPFSGSGVLVGPHHFLTAAHCVYDSRKMDGWAESLTIHPGLNDASAPFGAIRGVKAYLYQEWTEHENPDFDLALVILDKAVGEETGWAGMLALKEDALRELKVHVTGYPGDPSKRNQLWTMEDALDHVDPEQFAYKMHTSGGQSGGGIWINQWESPFVVGIHTMGYVGRNFGVRLSKQKLQDIIGWMEETGKITTSQAVSSSATSPSSSSSSSSSGPRLDKDALLEQAQNGDKSSLASLLLMAEDDNDAWAQYSLGKMYEDGDGVKKDMQKALRLYKMAAAQKYKRAQNALERLDEGEDHRASSASSSEAPFSAAVSSPSPSSSQQRATKQDDPEEQFNLGLKYATGDGVEKDDREAVRFFQLAADQGDAAAQFNLGVAYANGRGVEKDERQAVAWYWQAAEQGHAQAQFNLGWMYENGRGVARHETEAASWYWKAADQGLAQAQCNLGNMYENGLGVARDETEAASWYWKAADQGLAQAQYALGWMYKNGLGVAKDDAQAASWFWKAAEQGHANAQCNLGVMYVNGRGVAKDDAQAASWFWKAAEQGHADAQCNLGAMYANGRGGLQKDDREAVRFFQLAADQGHAGAQCALGVMYDMGRGVAKDSRRTVFWWQKAADQGDAGAQSLLGTVYRDGRCGLQKNEREAARLFQLAAEQGNTDAQQKLDAMKKNEGGCVIT